MKKLLLIAILAVNAVLTYADCTTTGTISGTSIVWKIEKGTLTFNGTGILPDYGFREAPWFCNQEAITNLVINEGITWIGKEALSGFTKLETMTSHLKDPKSVVDGLSFGNLMRNLITLYVPFEVISQYKDEDDNAWYWFKEILPISCPTSGSITNTTNTASDIIYWEIKDGTLTFSGIGYMPDYSSGTAPWSCNPEAITSIVIGAGIGRLGNEAFSNLTNLNSVTVYWEEPIDIVTPNPFGNLIKGDITLYVPFHLVETYKFAPNWRAFKHQSLPCETSGSIPGNTQNPNDLIYWAIDNGTLIFDGTGSLTGYDNGGAPWTCDTEAVTKVIINGGIVGIGHNIVDIFPNLSEITLPWSTTNTIPNSPGSFLSGQLHATMIEHVPVGSKSDRKSVV